MINSRAGIYHISAREDSRRFLVSFARHERSDINFAIRSSQSCLGFMYLIVNTTKSRTRRRVKIRERVFTPRIVIALGNRKRSPPGLSRCTFVRRIETVFSANRISFGREDGEGSWSRRGNCRTLRREYSSRDE